MHWKIVHVIYVIENYMAPVVSITRCGRKLGGKRETKNLIKIFRYFK